jgi:hypothetical protein
MKRFFQLTFLLALVAAVSVGSVRAYTGGPKSFRIRREVRDQLLLRLPKTMSMAGRSYSLEDVEIPRITEGPDGCSLDIVVDWTDGMHTFTGMRLNPDGFGRYNCMWITGDFGNLPISVPG